MLTEACVACGAEVPLSDAVHMLVNPKADDAEVVDGYVCRTCYADHVEPVIRGASPEPDAGAAAGADGDDAAEGDAEGERRPDADAATEDDQGGDQPAEGA